MSGERSAPDFAHLPTVLDTADLVNVLRVGRDAVHEIVRKGELHRLVYSRKIILVSRDEVLAFLERQTEASKPMKGI